MVQRLVRLHAAGCSDEEIHLAMRVPLKSVQSIRARLKLLAHKSTPYGRSLRRT